MTKPLEGEILSADAKTPVDEVKTARDEMNVRRDFWSTFRKALRYIPFSTELVAAYYCALDNRTPFHVRAAFLAALAYFVMPFDVLPDFIIGLGFSDDITLLAATLMRLRAHITDEHRSKAKQSLEEI
ncbi:MAG: DUF1232 domain-containing protein [Rhizobiales bacterium]|nr:DUF1232 domain-containing protein [Hyphomicrobiales bacterium]